MAELKTRPTAQDVETFLACVADERQRGDSRTLVGLMRRVTGAEPVMWGPTIVGFGRYRYRYASGREGDWFVVGFAPRKSDLSIYIMAGFSQYPELLARLGRHKTGKACLYVKRLADVDPVVLEELIRRSVEHVSRQSAEGGAISG